VRSPPPCRDLDLGWRGDGEGREEQLFIDLGGFALGGRGVISVVGNIVPGDVIALVKAVDAGNLVKAREWHRKLFPLCRDMLGLATNPIPIKAAMRMLGRDTGQMRMPMTPPQVRLPINFPRPIALNRYGKMSPSEAENSSMSVTIGPVKVCGGLVCGTPLRDISIMTSARRSRSMTSGETKPPPLPRTSTMSAFLRICGK